MFFHSCQSYGLPKWFLSTVTQKISSENEPICVEKSGLGGECIVVHVPHKPRPLRNRQRRSSLKSFALGLLERRESVRRPRRRQVGSLTQFPALQSKDQCKQVWSFFFKNTQLRFAAFVFDMGRRVSSKSPFKGPRRGSCWHDGKRIKGKKMR